MYRINNISLNSNEYISEFRMKNSTRRQLFNREIIEGEKIVSTSMSGNSVVLDNLNGNIFINEYITPLKEYKFLCFPSSIFYVNNNDEMIIELDVETKTVFLRPEIIALYYNKIDLNITFLAVSFFGFLNSVLQLTKFKNNELAYPNHNMQKRFDNLMKFSKNE